MKVKILIFLIVSLIATSSCSKKKNNNLPLLALLLGSSSSSDSDDDEDKGVVVDLTKAFDGLQDVIAVKSTVKLEDSVSAVLEPDEWKRLRDAGRVKVPKGTELKFAIVPKTGAINASLTIEIGTYTGTGNTDTIGFSADPDNPKDSDFKPKEGYDVYGITAVALIVKDAGVDTETKFEAVKKAAENPDSGEGILKAKDKTETDNAIEKISDSSLKTAARTAASEAKIKDAKDKASGKEGQSSVSATVGSYDNSKQAVTVTLTNGKFAANLNSSNVTATVYGYPNFNLRHSAPGNTTVTVSVFVDRKSDTEAEVGLNVIGTSTVVVNNLTYSFTFQQSAFNPEETTLDNLKENKVVIPSATNLKTLENKTSVQDYKNATIKSKAAVVSSAAYDAENGLVTLTGNFLAPKSCTSCGEAAKGELADDTALLTELKKLSIGDNTANNWKVDAKSDGSADGAATTKADVQDDTPANDKATYGYKSDGTKIWIRLHSEEKTTINALAGVKKGNGVIDAQTVAGNLDGSDGVGNSNAAAGTVLGISKGTSVATTISGWETKIASAAYDANEGLFTLTGTYLAPKSCTSCTSVANGIADDAALLAELKKLSAGSNTADNWKVTTKSDGRGSGLPTTDSADILDDTAPSDDAATYGYSSDGTKIWIRLHADEVHSIGLKSGYDSNGNINAQTVAGNLDGSDGVGYSNNGLQDSVLGITKGTSVATTLSGWLTAANTIAFVGTPAIRNSDGNRTASIQLEVFFKNGTDGSGRDLVNANEAKVLVKTDKSGAIAWNEALEVIAADGNKTNSLVDTTTLGKWATAGADGSVSAGGPEWANITGSIYPTAKASLDSTATRAKVAVPYCIGNAVNTGTATDDTTLTHIIDNAIYGGSIKVGPNFAGECSVVIAEDTDLTN